MLGELGTRTLQIIGEAQESARNNKQSCVTPADLLLRILSDEPSRISAILEESGIDASVLQNTIIVGRALEQMHQSVLPESTDTERVPLSDRCRLLLKDAQKVACLFQHTSVGPEHILLSILQQEDHASVLLGSQKSKRETLERFLAQQMSQRYGPVDLTLLQPPSDERNANYESPEFDGRKPSFLKDKVFPFVIFVILGTAMVAGSLALPQRYGGVDRPKIAWLMDPLSNWAMKERLIDDSQRIPFAVAGDRMLIKVRVNNAPEQWFLLDTGAQNCILDDRTFPLTEKNGRASISIADRNSTKRYKVVRLPQLSIGNSQFKNVTAALVDLSGVSIPGMKVCGILGTSIFMGSVLVVDRETGTIQLLSKAPHSSDQPVPFAQQKNNEDSLVEGMRGPRVMIEAQVDGKKTTATVDTGASVTSVPKSVLGSWFKPKPVTRTVYNTGINGKTNVVQSTVLQRLQAGAIDVTDLPVDVSDDEVYGDVLIANDVLKNYNITIDFPNQVVYLHKVGPSNVIPPAMPREVR